MTRDTTDGPKTLMVSSVSVTRTEIPLLVIVSVQTEPHLFEFLANWFRKEQPLLPHPHLLLLSSQACDVGCEQTVCLTHSGVSCHGAGEKSGSYSNVRLTGFTLHHRQIWSWAFDLQLRGQTGMWSAEQSSIPAVRPVLLPAFRAPASAALAVNISHTRSLTCRNQSRYYFSVFIR